ncbi:MAG: hypothetical protein PHE47_09155 [Oscillospiraceae bacterium]|nr:hypothetical protein [Oscillospiraceae bacterium]
MDRFRFSKEDIKQRGLKEWLHDYWFYYKWPTVIVLCVLILGGSILYSMLNQMQYDASVYLVCRSDTAAALDVDALQNKFENYAGDYDKKDGINVYFGYSALPTVTEENTNVDGLESQVVRPDGETEDIREYLAATTALAGEMDSDTAIYIFDEIQYNEMMEDTDHPIFINLSEKYPDLPLVDGCKLMVKDTVFAKDFLVVSDELFFVVRDLAYIRDHDKQKVIDHYEYQMDFFDAIVNANVEA